ncbi:hypothetical protein Gogos_013051, partial [Gossypium gossypioides]|nr:hypothetical protein [Gossypium gossypioides]
VGSSFVTFLFDVVRATKDLKVGVENDGAAVGAKLLQKRSWK